MAEYQSISTTLEFNVDVASLTSSLAQAESLIQSTLGRVQIADSLTGLINSVQNLAVEMGVVSDRMQKVGQAAAKVVDLNAKSTEQLKKASEVLNKMGSNAQEGFDQLAGKVERVKDKVIEADDATKRMKDSAHDVGDVFDGWLGKIAKVGSLIAGAIGGHKVWETMKDLQQSQAEFTGLMHSSDRAEQFLGRLHAYVKKTGFEFNALQTAARGFLQVGMGEDKTMDLLTRMHDIAGNSTERFRVLGEVINQAANNMGKVERSTVFKLARSGFDIMPVIAANRGQTVEEMFNETVTKVTPAKYDKKGNLVKAATTKTANSISQLHINVNELIGAIETATNKGGVFFGNADRQAATLAGRVGAMLETIRFKLAKALDWLSPYLGKFVESFGHIFEMLAGFGMFLWHTLGKPFFTIMVIISHFFNFLMQSLDKANKGVRIFAKVVGYALGALAIAVTASLFQIMTAVGRFVGMLVAAFILVKNATVNVIMGIWNLKTATDSYIGSLIREIKLTYDSILAKRAENAVIRTQTVLTKNMTRAQIGLNTAKNIALGIAVMAAVEGVTYAYDKLMGKGEDEAGASQWALNALDGKESWRDQQKAIEKLTQEFNITNNMTMNAPQDKSGKTALNSQQVTEMLRRSRSDFSMEIQNAIMEAHS